MNQFTIIIFSSLIVLIPPAANACTSCFMDAYDDLPEGGGMPMLFGVDDGTAALEAKIEKGFLANETSFRPRNIPQEQADDQPTSQSAYEAPVLLISNQTLYSEDGNSFQHPFENTAPAERSLADATLSINQP